MKVFFNFSGRSTQDIVNYCKIIYSELIRFGFKHTFDCFFNHSINELDQTNVESEELYSKCIKAIKRSDVVVLELSTNSFTQGFILQKSIEMNKPVIALHLPNASSVFLKGFTSELVQLVEYEKANLSDVLKQSINIARERTEARFNFYITPKIYNYLKWASKKHKQSKSAFVRTMLQKMMDRDIEYLS